MHQTTLNSIDDQQDFINTFTSQVTLSYIHNELKVFSWWDLAMMLTSSPHNNFQMILWLPKSKATLTISKTDLNPQITGYSFHKTVWINFPLVVKAKHPENLQNLAKVKHRKTF